MKSHLFSPRVFSFRSLRTGIGLMRRVLPGRYGLGVAVAGSLVIAAGSPVWAEGRQVAEKGDDVIAVVRAPAPKQLMPKIMEVAREVQPGPGTEALPFILGGMLGDPMLTGISATENIGLVLLENGDGVAPVLVLSLPESSPLRSSLPGFDMSLKDFESWSFAAPDDAFLSLVEGREKALIEAVRGTRRYDLEVALNVDGFSEKLREAAGAFAGEGSGNLLVSSLMEVIATESAAIRDVRAGMNFSGREIEQAFYLGAAEGSPLASFLDQRRPGDLEFARFVEADAAVTFLGGIDAGATRAYFDYLTDQFRDREGGGPSVWKSMLKLGSRYLSTTNGATGGALSLDGLRPRMTSVSPSSMREEEFERMLQDMVAGMGEIFDGVGEEGMPVYSLLMNEFEVNGSSINILRTELNLSPEEAAALEGVAGFGEAFGRQDVYYGLVDGHIVTASDPDRIRAAIEAIQKGESVETNVGSTLSVREDDLFAFEIDFVRYFGGMMTAVAPGMGMDGLFTELGGLPPFAGTVAARGGEAEIRMAVPLETIMIAYQAIASFTAGQQQALPVQP